MLSLNKEIKLGLYSVLFNKIRNQYMFKEGNRILFRCKNKDAVIVKLDTLHDKEKIDIIEYDLFLDFITKIELTRNKPLIGRHNKQLTL